MDGPILSPEELFKFKTEIAKGAQKLVNLGYLPCRVHFGQKKPQDSKWTNPVPPEEILARFSGKNPCNLGVVLGQVMPGQDTTLGVPGAIDVDNDDPRHIEFLDGLFDHGKVVRRKGTKGCVQFVRLAGIPENYPGTSAGNIAKIELLFDNRMAVLPPSILGDPNNPYHWLTPDTLFDVELADLPEMGTDESLELVFYTQYPDDKMFSLHFTTYLGEGAGGGFNESLTQTVAAYIAHKFEDDYIIKRCANLARLACKRGGLLDEFNRTWDVVKEIEGQIKRVHAKYDSGEWELNKFTRLSPARYDMSKAKMAEETRPQDMEVSINIGERHGIKTATLVTKQFDERKYSAGYINNNGGVENWAKIIDEADGNRVDPDYAYQFKDGYWQRVVINPRSSNILSELRSHYGIKDADAMRALKVMPDFMSVIKKHDIENTQNRFVKLNKGTLEFKHEGGISFYPQDKQEYFCTHRIKANFIEAGETRACPIYDQFINHLFTQSHISYHDERTPEQMLADKETSIRCFEEFMGYTFVRHTGMQKALFLKGKPKTGKSIALGLLRFFHDKTFSAISLREMSKPETREELTRSLVNICPEIAKNTEFPVDDFKKIVDGTDMSVRRLYEQLRSNVPITARLVFAMNEFPTSIEVNESIERRMIVLSCNNVVTERYADQAILEKMKKEASGIFMRWIEGAGRVMERGHFILPESHKVELQIFKSQNDSMHDFFAKEVEAVGTRLVNGTHLEEVWTSENDAFNHFNGFCNRNGVKFWSCRTFSNRLMTYLKSYPEANLKTVTSASGEKIVMFPIKLRHRG